MILPQLPNFSHCTFSKPFTCTKDRSLFRLPEARNNRVALQSDESHQTRYTHIFWIDWVKFGLFRQVWQHKATCEVCCPSVRPCARAKPSGGPTFRPDAQSVACSEYRGIYWLFRSFQMSVLFRLTMCQSLDYFLAGSFCSAWAN